MLVRITFALLNAWGSGYLAHEGNVPAAVLLGGENPFLGLFQINSFSRSLHLLCRQQRVQEEEVNATVTRSPLLFQPQKSTDPMSPVNSPHCKYYKTLVIVNML